MGLTEDLLATVEDVPVRDVRVGAKYTCVGIGDRLGVCHTLFEPGNYRTPAGAGQLAGRKLARLAMSDDPLEGCIGTAAVNALLNPARSESDENIFHRILAMAPDFERIGVVGEFPFVGKLDPERTAAFEQRDVPGYLAADMEEEVIPQCDLVVITGCALANNTLGRLLSISSGYTMVIGPSTPLSPVLFDHGADLLAGVCVDDARVMDIIGQGGGARDFIGLCRNVIMEREE